MRKVINWIFKSKVDLSKKWWHRFFKVLFVISIVAYSIYLVTVLFNSYAQVTHQWRYVESLSNRLSEASYSNKVFSVSKLYGDNEVISEDKYPSGMTFGLNDKEYLLPFSPMFLENNQAENFCSDELYKHISGISSTNNINLFSTTNPTLEKLYADIDIFTAYLKNNSYSIKCVMLDSYSITNDDGTTSEFPFLRPVDTSEYNIYNYNNNFSGFILNILLVIAFLLFYILCMILIYYKVILYIVYGKIERSFSE